jgi:hypothetical protein
MSSNYDEETAESLFGVADELACTPADLPELVDDENFRKLQASLRSRGCITNGYIQQNLHKYVQHVRVAKQAKLRRCSSHIPSTMSNK